MNQDTKSQPDRRATLKASLRYAAAGLLAAFGIGAAARHRRLYDGRCISRSVCSDCRIFPTCGLPLALSSRRAMKEHRHG